MNAPEIRLRDSPRVFLDGGVRLRLLPEGPEIEGRLLDLSASGMGVAAATAAAPGQGCVFELVIDGERVAGQGVVIWGRRPRPDRHDAPNLGVRFDLDPRGAMRVGELVERHRVRRRGIVPSRSSGGGEGAVEAPPAPVTVAVAPVSVAPQAADTVAVAPASVPLQAAVQAVAPATVPAQAPEKVAGDAPLPAAVASPTELEVEEGTGSSGRSAARWRAGVALGAAVVIVVAVLVLRSNPRPAVEPRSAMAPEVVVAAAADGPEPAGAPGPAEPASAHGAERGDGAAVAAGSPESASRAVSAPVLDDPGVEGAGLEAPSRARRILAIESERGADGDEVVVVRADAPLRRDDVFAALIGPDPPRYLLRLTGIDRQFRPATLEVGSPLVQRVRTGLHSTARGPQLHLVLDLATRDVEHSWTMEGETLRVRLRSRSP